MLRLAVIFVALATAAVLAALSGPVWGDELIRVDARNSAKFIKPSKIGPTITATNCFPSDYAASRLAEKYGEHRSGGGFISSTHLIEVWFSESAGTWTILRTGADGMSCVLASGQGWRERRAEPTGPAS